MSQRSVDYGFPPKTPSGWRTGDSVFLGAVILYALFNFALMMMYAGGMLGPVPFRLIFLFLWISGIGILAAFPAQFAVRRWGVTWRSALGAVICFVALAAFNFWCLVAASAAV